MSIKPEILIVDDEPLARKRLRKLCERQNIAADLAVASGGDEAIDFIVANSPDIVLLDIDMPDISGIEVAHQCQLMRDFPEVIFTTAHSKYAVEAFRLDATDYILKPVKETHLREALDRALARLDRRKRGQVHTHDQRIWVKDEKGSIQLRVVDVEYIQAERDYMRLVVSGRNYLVHGSMLSFEEKFPDEIFMRVHRSAMVRIDFVREIRRDGRRRFLVLNDETEITVGPSFHDDVTKKVSSQAGGFGTSDTVTE